MILYAASIWYNDIVKLAGILLSIQGDHLLICVTKCYLTISTDSLDIMAGILPLDLRAGMNKGLAAFVRCRRI